MDAYLIKACFPLVMRNATERLQEIIDDKIDEFTDKITDGVLNKTTEFLFAEDLGVDILVSFLYSYKTVKVYKISEILKNIDPWMQITDSWTNKVVINWLYYFQYGINPSLRQKR